MNMAVAEDVAARRVLLEGAVNCRDLGGYLNRSGLRVRSGMVFRSDQLAEITEADKAQLQALGLRSLCDLRAAEERQQKPNQAFFPPAPRTYDLGFMPKGGDRLISDARAGSIKIAEIKDRVIDIYRHFVTDRTENFARLLHLLSTESCPVLIHCTSGRDRTGVASALILSALDVPEETIFEDYIISDYFRRDLAFQMGDVGRELMDELTKADPDYLQAAFDVMATGWGSVDGYISKALQLSDEKREVLRQLLLTDAEVL